MTPIEAAARAACLTDYGGDEAWQADDMEHLWRDYIPIVRAAMAATREASDQMVDAIHSTHRPGWDVSWRYVWKTMLDALLAEQPEPPT